MLLIAALPTAVASALWALYDLQRFVMFAVLTAMMLPATIIKPAGSNVAAADILLMIALVAWLVTNSLRANPDPFVRGNRILLPTSLFIAINAISLAWSDQPKHTLAFTIQLVSITVLTPLVFASLPRSLRVVRQGLVLFVGLSCVMATAALIDFAPRAAHGDFEGTYLPGLHKNAIGSFVAAGLILAYAIGLSERRRAPRRWMATAMLVELGGLFASGSRGSILGCLLAVIAVSLLRRRRRVMTLFLVALSTTVFLMTVGPEGGRKKDESGSYDSSVVRTYSFANALHKIKQRPILGTGGGTYQDYIPQLNIGLDDPNNMFLLTWAEDGIFGLAALLFLLYRYLRLWWRTARLPEEAAIIGVAAGGVSLSLFVHFQVDVTWTRGTTTLAFAMIGVMLAAQRLSAAADDSARPTAAPAPHPSLSPTRQPVGTW